jgi:hypothetical protein
MVWLHFADQLREAAPAAGPLTFRAFGLDRIRKRVEAELSNLLALLNEDPMRAWSEIIRQVTEIDDARVRRRLEGLVAEGEWDLLPKTQQKAKVTGASAQR